MATVHDVDVDSFCRLWSLEAVCRILPAIYVDSYATIQTAQQYNAQYDFTKVLLCHARVHVMADRFQATALEELAIYKMHQFLSNIIASGQSHLGDLVSILDCVYNTTGLESSMGPSRDLLAQHAAGEVRSRMEGKEFQDFLSGNGSFAYGSELEAVK
jgi:hypothetical protein